MKKRNLYYRKWNKSIIIEGKRKGKNIHIWTLPSPEKLLALLENLSNNPPLQGNSGPCKNCAHKLFTKDYLSKQKEACDFMREKMQKINEKIKRVDFKAERQQKSKKKVLSTKIITT